jgi:hypothetical protein
MKLEMQPAVQECKPVCILEIFKTASTHSKVRSTVSSNGNAMRWLRSGTLCKHSHILKRDKHGMEVRVQFHNPAALTPGKELRLQRTEGPWGESDVLAKERAPHVLVIEPGSLVILMTVLFQHKSLFVVYLTMFWELRWCSPLQGHFRNRQ